MRTRDITVDIPYVDIVGQHAAIKDELLAAVAGVIDSGQFILGEEVGEFELSRPMRAEPHMRPSISTVTS